MRLESVDMAELINRISSIIREIDFGEIRILFAADRKHIDIDVIKRGRLYLNVDKKKAM